MISPLLERAEHIGERVFVVTDIFKLYVLVFFSQSASLVFFNSIASSRNEKLTIDNAQIRIVLFYKFGNFVCLNQVLRSQ